MSSQSPTVTQIIYLIIPPTYELGSENSDVGKQWSAALDLFQQSPGFQRLYWGRRLEEPEKVQLHIVKETLQQHMAFLASAIYQRRILPLLTHLVPPSTPVTSPTNSSPNSSSVPYPPRIFIRHVHLTRQFAQSFSPTHVPLGASPSPSSSPPTPIGTAIYLSTTPAWHTGAWPLWTHVVRHVPGCLAIAGGSVEEPVDGHNSCYLVYVAWESVDAHDAYHHTRHFAERKIILALGNEGWKEYGHVLFQGSREGRVAGMGKL